MKIRKMAAILDQMAVSGGNFLFTIVVARLLGLEEFGYFSVLWMIVLFFNSFHMASIVLPMLSQCTKHEGNEKSQYYNMVYSHQKIFNLLSVLICFLGWVCVQYFRPVPFTQVVALVLLCIAYHTQEFFRRYFFCEEDIIKVLVVDSVAYGGRFIPLIVAYWQGWQISFSFCMGSMTLAYAVSSLVGRLMSGSFERLDSKTWLAFSRLQWGMSRYLLPSALMQWFSINFHMMIAGVLLGVQSVGIIRLGQTLMAVGNVYLQSLENVLPIRISKIQKSHGLLDAYRYIKRYMFIGSLWVLVGVGSISLVASDVMGMVFGSEYRQHVSIVYWFGAIYLFAFLLVPVRAFMRAMDQTRLWFKAYVLATIASILIFYPLQKTLGIHGVMMGMLISYLVLITYSWFLIEKEVVKHAFR